MSTAISKKRKVGIQIIKNNIKKKKPLNKYILEKKIRIYI
jgi:hypothetical protein